MFYTVDNLSPWLYNIAALYNKPSLRIGGAMRDFVVGGPVTVDDFMFREEIIEEIWESLRKNNILFLAPRRMGKTSVMYHLMERPREDWLVVYLNVEELAHPAEFCIHLLSALYESHPKFLKESLAGVWDFLKGIFSKIEEVEAFDFKIVLKNAKFHESWRDKAHELMDRIHQSGRKVLFLVDELPDMLVRMQKQYPAETSTFLHFFRGIRIRPKSCIRWFLAGSVNLEGTLDQMGEIKSVNDMEKIILQPFSPDEVASFTSQMLNEHKVEFDPEIICRIQELIGEPIPYFLQLLTQELYRHWKQKRERISVPIVSQVYEKSLLGERARDKLQHFRSRIDIHYPEEEKEASCRLLDQLSATDCGHSRNALFSLYQKLEGKKAQPRTEGTLKKAFNNLLLLLESDFYIRETEGRQLDFSNKLLKQWWKKYYGYNC